MKYLNKPNLPDNSVGAVIASHELSECAVEKLKSSGIFIIDTYNTRNVDMNISKHADISIVHLGNEVFMCVPESKEYYSTVLHNTNICTGRDLFQKYPGDVAYNVAFLANYIICKEEATSSEIIRFAEKHDISIINTAQGYAKCNISIISDNAIITSDYNINRAVKKFGIDVLLVDDSAVLLKGYNHGFFGGATGKISPDKLAVNGDINTHINCNEIINFASRYDVEIVSLCDGNIEDIGSILPILEK